MFRTWLRRATAGALLALVAACGAEPPTPEQAAAEIAARLAAADLEAADERLRAAIMQWPEDGRLRELQGDLDLERGHGTRAQAAYEKALRGSPGDRALEVKLARALLAQNRLREVELLAVPRAGDAADVRAGLALLRLEAALAGRNADEQALRTEAEALWRLSAVPAPTPAMADVRRRLARLAGREAAVEAGRQHASCRPPAQPAPGAETDAAAGALVRVGPGETLTTPAAAAAVVEDGSVIEIAVGDYREAPVLWRQSNLTLRGRQGRPRLHPAGRETPALLWILAGENIVVENIEFVGPAAADGAAIRLDGAHLTVRGSVFRGGGRGIVAGDSARGEILVTGSLFVGEERTARAAVDVGRIARLRVEFSHLDGDRYGRTIRSRARETAVNYNRIVDEPGSARGALLDFPAGGRVEILGNELLRGPGGRERAFVAFGAPRTQQAHEGSELSMLANTFFNRAAGRTAVQAHLAAPALIANNVFGGAPVRIVEGDAVRGGNFEVGDDLTDPAGGDFRLRAGSAAIDSAVDPDKLRAGAPRVEFEYVHPRAGAARELVWRPDAGAHEYCAGAAGPVAAAPF